ncbi:MAG: YihY/virulence factor BrkB family protein, partial [Halohasta sp.]
MLHSSRRLVSTGWAVAGVIRTSRVSFLAAATAYYAFVSVFPLVLLVLAVGSIVGGEPLAERVVATIGNALSPNGQTLLVEAITSDAGRGGATIVGIAGLLWGGLRVFRGLDLAFAAIYGTSGQDGFLTQLRNAGVALGALGVGVVAVVGGNLFLSLTTVPLGGVPDTIGILIALTVGLVPLYYVLPDVPMALRTALPGAAAAAIGWTVLSALFRIYAANAAQFDAYGVVGGV